MEALYLGRERAGVCYQVIGGLISVLNVCVCVCSPGVEGLSNKLR